MPYQVHVALCFELAWKTKMMSGSKIVLPSSDADEYTLHALRSTIISIVNPKGACA